MLDETGADAALVKELEDFGVIKGERHDGETFYDDTEREIVRAVTELKRFGVGGRNLRVFRTSADREAALLEQILAPALRSRNPERRKEAVEALENLAAIASHLKHLLLIRDLRKLAQLTLARRAPPGPHPGHPGLPQARDRLQGHHAGLPRPGALRLAIDALAGYASGARVDYVVSAEARGFVLGAAVAAAAGAGFVLARKPGKLPREVASVEYELEYGVDALEVHADAVAGGARVLVHDDLLATGGTAARCATSWSGAGGVVAGCAFVIELAFLGGRERLAAYDVHSLVVVRVRVIVRRDATLPAAPGRGLAARFRPRQAARAGGRASCAWRTPAPTPGRRC